MLLGQNLRRIHQRDGPSAFDGHQRGAGGNDGFARAHIALQQSAHRMPRTEVRADFSEHFGLRVGEFESETFEERAHQVICTGTGQGGRARFPCAATFLNRELQRDELVQREPPSRSFDFIRLLGKVNHPKRLGAGW